MEPVRPQLSGVDPRRADAFVRSRTLSWRSLCRGSAATARLSLVACAEIEARADLADDAAWWYAPVRQALDLDLGTRIDLMRRLVLTAPSGPLVAVWTRPGPNEETGSDLGWFGALRHTCPGEQVRLLVITGGGWHSLPDAVSRSWSHATVMVA